MTERSKAPPPISPVRDLPNRAAQSSPDGMEKIEMSFADPFAPSHADFYSNGGDSQNPASRHLFYNQQLYNTLFVAIDRAIELGFPPIDQGFPLSFAFVTDESIRHIFQCANAICPTVPEASYDWLCIQCYVRWANTCYFVTVPSKVPLSNDSKDYESEERSGARARGLAALMVSSESFFLGAAIRELELSIINRCDALRGKKTLKSAQNGGEARRNSRSGQTTLVLTTMARLIGDGHTVSNAARLAAKEIGGNSEAHRKLWHRRAGKLGHTPPMS
jgi:hypothetical protein